MGKPFRQLFVFGDSYSDIGAGYVDGNGPTAVYYMAQKMGLTLMHPWQVYTKESSLCFAVSGAQTGKWKGRTIEGAFLSYGMMNQVEDFVRLVKEGALIFKPESTLFFFAGGLNDGDVATKKTLKNLTAQIAKIKGLGGYHFTVAQLPEAIPPFSVTAKRLNPHYKILVEQLKKELSIDVTLNPWGHYFDTVYQNGLQYGFVNTKDRCAGRAIFKEDPMPCASPDEYYFYHDGHPSTAVHKIVGEWLAESQWLQEP